MTSIQEICEKFDRISVATPADNKDILNFYSSIAMDTQALQLRYERAPNFFTFLAEQGMPTVVFLFKNDDGSIGGVSSLTTRNCLINGNQAKIFYAGDLRSSPRISRKARVQWRRCYAEIVAHYRSCEDLGRPDYMYTVIMDGNKKALQAFIKPKANPVYRKLMDFNSINIVGQICRPICNVRNKRSLERTNYQIDWANNDDFSAIKRFLHNENKGKKLGTNFTVSGAGELERRLQQWNNFAISSFLMVRQNGEIVACLAPWSNGNSRRIVVEKAPLPLKIFGSFLPLCGQRAIKENHELKTLYLTCLEIDSSKGQQERAELFGFMVDFLFASGRRRGYNLISSLDGLHCSLGKGIERKGYMYSKQRAALYQVLSPEEALEKRFLSVTDGEIVGFELATA